MDMIRDAIMVLVPMILSLTVHEYAHAASAYLLGDDTAAYSGRMTLNPVAHIDVFGTILLPLISVVSGSHFFFGWAKPVPINPTRLTRKVSMKTGVLLTAAAGPVSNILFAFVLAVAFKLLSMGGYIGVAAMESPIFHLLMVTFQINIVLAVFNFIPVPPLDGSRVLVGLLPDSLGRRFEVLERNPMFTILAFGALIAFGGRLLAGPVQALTHLILKITGNY